MVIAKRKQSIPSTLTPNTSAQLKYRPFVETGRWASKGTKPLPDPVTIPEAFTKVMVHCCKRVLYLDIKYRILGYAIILFFFSLVADYMPFPKSYFSNSQNFPNQYFVKFSWAWTFAFVGLFMFLTTSVYCCADRKKIQNHFMRLLIATIVWFICTNTFAAIEEATGRCIYSTVGESPEAVFSRSRKPCINNKGKWTSFDISGHAFLLIWCVLFIIEETKPIIGWDLIQDHIRNEDHKRTETNTEAQETPLSTLSNEDFNTLKSLYKKFGIGVKISIVMLTLLTLIWDAMLIATACYFHIMIEKILGGLLAILMWWLTYRTLYKLNIDLLPPPGLGSFKYSPVQYGSPSKSAAASAAKPKQKEVDDLPTFMGMPLYALRNKQHQVPPFEGVTRNMS